MKKLLVTGVLVLTCIAGSAAAQSDVMDTIGYLFESNNDPSVVGFPPSDAGDVLAGVGFVDNISAPLTWSTADYEYTWVIGDLVSGGAADLGNGSFRIYYTGGTIDIYAQAFLSGGYSIPDYGVAPPDPLALATFSDGDVYLHGVFTNFSLTYNPTTGIGSYVGTLTFELGTHFTELGQELQNPNGLTLAGTVLNDATIPEGYDMETDGHIYYDGTIPTESKSWGEVKNLYR
ncbi:MAG: hypothetical protein Q7W56_13010 [Candidatus Latescibacteria bacterium]|nr:hypothetical protein [Candidatus Latescibacterota bacterium]